MLDGLDLCMHFMQVGIVDFILQVGGVSSSLPLAKVYFLSFGIELVNGVLNCNQLVEYVVTNISGV